MYDPEQPEGFYKMEPVMSLPDDPYISFGWSSPWPMDNLYQIHNQENQTEITYYAMTSDPHRWVWKERITWKKTGGVWYVDQSRLTQYEKIQSAAEFHEAYSGGIAGTHELQAGRDGRSTEPECPDRYGVPGPAGPWTGPGNAPESPGRGGRGCERR